VSFIVSTEDQAETDRHWNAIIDHGGEPVSIDMMAQDALESRAVAQTAAPPPFNPGVNTSAVTVRVDFALTGE